MITNLMVNTESLDSLSSYRTDPNNQLKWDIVFTLPSWLKVWWQSFGNGAELYIRSVKEHHKTIGIAPLQIRDHTASIIGSINVCDYQDFITLPGLEKEFFTAIVDDLRKKGVHTLELDPLRPDSAAMTYLIPLAKESGLSVDCHQSDISMDLDLPSTFEEYLEMLDSKQRHEIRRKIRNLGRIGETNYRVIADKSEIPDAANSFLQLFPEYRRDKADFLTDEMKSFFRSLAAALAEDDAIRFGVLEYNHKALAMIIYFDYNEGVYLYNSAYDPAYKNMSVGIISKALCIQDNIQRGKKKFDFLKGSEQYKYYMGGKEIPLSYCKISIQ